jgi:hypothetical protein
MAVEKSKALADYESCMTNAFWLYFTEDLEKWLGQIRAFLDDANDPIDIYRYQGKVEILKTIKRKPDELIKVLRQ